MDKKSQNNENYKSIDSISDIKSHSISFQIFYVKTSFEKVVIKMIAFIDLLFSLL